jgi:hypothetical protein
MKLRSLLVFIVLTTGLAFAQIAANAGGVAVSTAGVFTGGFQGIKGVPYSADVITETTRVLADGNRIHQEIHGKQFRDSEGRTRTETEFQMPFQEAPFQHIAIEDPVQGIFLSLDSRSKMAIIHHFGNAGGQTPRVPNPPATATRPQARLRMLDQPRTEDLGTMEIEGFTVKGTRHTRTIPAGQIGNDQPITSVQETWMSPVLKTVLLNKHDDPQSGQRIMKLVNIQTTEPDPSLFQVPPDYTVKDDGAPR